MDDKPEILALKLLYHEAFGNNSHDFFRQHIDLTVGSWMSDLKQLIDEVCLNDIILEINDKEKAIIVARYLIQKNDIRKYKAFIEIWKKHVPARAEQFQRRLRTKIEDNGLPMVDELYDIASVAQAQRDEDIRPNNIDRNLEYSNDVEMESDKRFSNCVSHVFSNSVEMLSENRSSSGNNADLVAFGHGQVNSSLSNEEPLNFGKHLFDTQHWKKLSKLGKGAYGEVYLYEQVHSKVQIAVKAVKFDPDDCRAMGILQSEIKTHQLISHHRIVQYYGYYVDDTDYVVYICLEYVPRGSIRSYLESNRRLKNDTVKKYTRQILEGVAYLHGKAIVHRDIKGANVLIDEKDDVKLADFGMSKELHSLTSGGKTGGKGTIRWMAPEVANDENHGIAADIWSVGCTVVEMITAKKPWANLTNAGAIVKQLNKKQFPPYELSEPYKDAGEFLGQCFIIDHRARPSAESLLRMEYCAAL